VGVGPGSVPPSLCQYHSCHAGRGDGRRGWPCCAFRDWFGITAAICQKGRRNWGRHSAGKLEWVPRSFPLALRTACFYRKLQLWISGGVIRGTKGGGSLSKYIAHRTSAVVCCVLPSQVEDGTVFINGRPRVEEAKRINPAMYSLPSVRVPSHTLFVLVSRLALSRRQQNLQLVPFGKEEALKSNSFMAQKFVG
jgi:hypothetical protein